MHYRHSQRKRLILLTIITIGVLILCLAFCYSRYNSNSHQPVANPSAGQSLKVIAEDDATFLSRDLQVKDISTRWQAIKTLSWEKDYHPLCQARYLYRKGHYIRALALGTFNVLLLPSLWGYTAYVFWGAPLTIFGFPISPASWRIVALRLIVHFLIINRCLSCVYQLCERFIGERLIIDESYTPVECQEIKALLTATETLLTQRDLTPLDDASVDEMKRLKAALLSVKEAYNNAISAETSLTIQRNKKEVLQEYQQAWRAKYATHHENELLQSLSKGLQEKMWLVTYIEHN